MSQRSLSQQSKNAAPLPHQHRGRRYVVLGLVIGLILLAALGIAAQQPTRKAPRKTAPSANAAKAAAQTNPTPVLAKEYIYASGKLVATEEPSGFNDVPSTHPFYADILKLAAREVTLGCQVNPPLYCPECPVTRDQMAIFIERALGVHTPPPGPATPTFADVPNSGFTDYSFEFIEDFVLRGITIGCDAGPPRRYCPGDRISHTQMAIFMCRAKGVSTFDPNTPLPPQTFCDVPPSHSFYRFIDYYVNTLRFWPGCGEDAIPGNNRSGTNTCVSDGNANCSASCTMPLRKFCPNCAVTRGEMAYILVRAFNL